MININRVDIIYLRFCFLERIMLLNKTFHLKRYELDVFSIFSLFFYFSKYMNEFSFIFVV